MIRQFWVFTQQNVASTPLRQISIWFWNRKIWFPTFLWSQTWPGLRDSHRLFWLLKSSWWCLQLLAPSYCPASPRGSYHRTILSYSLDYCWSRSSSTLARHNLGEDRPRYLGNGEERVLTSSRWWWSAYPRSTTWTRHRESRRRWWWRRSSGVWSLSIENWIRRTSC